MFNHYFCRRYWFHWKIINIRTLTDTSNYHAGYLGSYKNWLMCVQVGRQGILLQSASTRIDQQKRETQPGIVFGHCKSFLLGPLPPSPRTQKKSFACWNFRGTCYGVQKSLALCWCSTWLLWWQSLDWIWWHNTVILKCLQGPHTSSSSVCMT